MSISGTDPFRNRKKDGWLTTITGSGSWLQASVAERPVALPPVNAIGNAAMPTTIHDATHWYDRASEMRALSETIDIETRAIMLRLADDFDKLADRVIQLAALQRPPGA